MMPNRVKLIAFAICLAILILFAISPETNATSDLEVKRTWENASVLIPGHLLGEGKEDLWGLIRHKYVQRELAAIPSNRSIPAIVYLHGCTGTANTSDIDATMLTEMGYAVFMPNSFARSNRRAKCKVAKVEVLQFRIDEATYALNQLRQIPGIDSGNIFLMGMSEGGLAAAVYDGRGFAGHIITGWTCINTFRMHGNAREDGIRVPTETPILSVVASRDPYYQNANLAGHCGQRMGGRDNAVSIVIDAKQHWVNHIPEARDAIMKFLRAHTKMRRVTDQ